MARMIFHVPNKIMPEMKSVFILDHLKCSKLLEKSDMK